MPPRPPTAHYTSFQVRPKNARLTGQAAEKPQLNRNNGSLVGAFIPTGCRRQFFFFSAFRSTVTTATLARIEATMAMSPTLGRPLLGNINTSPGNR